MAMPGVSLGLNHSFEIQACGLHPQAPLVELLMELAGRQSSSQVPLTVTLRLERRCLSNSSSDSFSQANFRRGIRHPEGKDGSVSG